MRSSFTKIRPAFDDFSKEQEKFPLSDILAKGPNLIEKLSDIIDRFGIYIIVEYCRTHEY